MTKIKKCPFCGNQPAFEACMPVLSSQGKLIEEYFIECHCEAEPFVLGDKAEAITMWNTRPLKDAALTKMELSRDFYKAECEEYVPALRDDKKCVEKERDIYQSALEEIALLLAGTIATKAMKAGKKVRNIK